MFAQLRAPSTFDYVVPSVHFERRVDLFSSFVAPKAAQHRNAMENEKLVQEVFGKISSRLRVLFAGMRLELREQKCALFPKGLFRAQLSDERSVRPPWLRDPLVHASHFSRACQPTCVPSKLPPLYSSCANSNAEFAAISKSLRMRA